MTLSTVLLAGLVMLGGAAADTAEPESKPPTEAESEALLRTLLKHQADHRARCLENIHVEFEFRYAIPHGMYTGVGNDDGPEVQEGTGVRTRRGALRYMQQTTKRSFEQSGFSHTEHISAVVNAHYVAFARVGSDGSLRIERIDHTDPGRLSHRARNILVPFDPPGLLVMGYTDGLEDLAALFRTAQDAPGLSMSAHRLDPSVVSATHRVDVHAQAQQGVAKTQMQLDADRGYLVVRCRQQAADGSLRTEHELSGLREFAPECWFPYFFHKERTGHAAYTLDAKVKRVTEADEFPDSHFSLERLCEGHTRGSMQRWLLSGEVRTFELRDGRWVPTE